MKNEIENLVQFTHVASLLEFETDHTLKKLNTILLAYSPLKYAGNTHLELSDKTLVPRCAARRKQIGASWHEGFVR